MKRKAEKDEFERKCSKTCGLVEEIIKLFQEYKESKVAIDGSPSDTDIFTTIENGYCHAHKTTHRIRIRVNIIRGWIRQSCKTTGFIPTNLQPNSTQQDLLREAQTGLELNKAGETYDLSSHLEIHFRSTNAKDFKRVRKMLHDKELHEESSGFLNNIELIKNYIESDPADETEIRSMVAEDENDNILGYFMFTPGMCKSPSINAVKIDIAYVRPVARRQGITSAFLTELMCAYKGLQWINVSPIDSETLLFWRRRGFEHYTSSYISESAERSNYFDIHGVDRQSNSLCKRVGSLASKDVLPPDRDGLYLCGKCKRHGKPEEFDPEYLTLPAEYRYCNVPYAHI